MTQPYSENYNLSNRNWRALSYDWDTLSTYSNQNGNLYCLSDFQARWLQSNLPYMAWQTRWDNCPCTPEELAEFAGELEYALMQCVEIQPYQIDYTYNQTVLNQLAVFEGDYVTLPSEVNPNTPDDFFSGDSSQDRLDALCTATKVYIYSYIANWIPKAELVLGFSIVAGFLVSISIVGGVIAGTVLAGLALITQTALNAMNDEDAVNRVVCCMYNNMNGTVINQANFEASLDGCGFLVGSNEAIIRDIIASDLVQFSNLLSFYNVLGDMLPLAEAGVNDCPCDDTWQHTFDFIVDNTAQGWTPFIGRALLTPTGWVQQPADLNTVQIERTFLSTRITSIEIFNSGLASGICGNFYSFRLPDVAGADGIFDTNLSQINIDVTSTGLWVSLCTGDDTTVRIQRILLEGTGVNPF